MIKWRTDIPKHGNREFLCMVTSRGGMVYTVLKMSREGVLWDPTSGDDSGYGVDRTIKWIPVYDIEKLLGGG